MQNKKRVFKDVITFVDIHQFDLIMALHEYPQGNLNVPCIQDLHQI